MTISIWRYSHLTLAISSALFITIASLTGIILAFEPISNKLKPYEVVPIENVSIAETLAVLQQKYDEIITLEIDENNFVSANVILENGKSETFYINPTTGNKIGKINLKTPIFEFATNLHRSLFLKSTGRFIVGFVSFLLFLISVSGVILISKRQGGFSRFFSKIIKEDFNQYYHIIIGRYTLIPIIIITITGVYLSLEKFSLLPKDTSTHEIVNQQKVLKSLKLKDFEVFKTTKLNEVKKIEFPFSNDEEDYFFVKLYSKDLVINQFTGQIISQKKETLTSLGSYYSLILHTGKGSVIWSIILLLSCFAILFFIISGFSITLKRRKKKVLIKNKFKKDNAEFIILVGSETGSTFKFATAFYNALINAKKTVFISQLNDYNTYKNAENIIVFTATYGDGDAPVNATKFIDKITKINQNKILKFSVIGFGSLDYKEYCKYAILVQSHLQLHQNFIPISPVFKVNNQSFSEFNIWLNEWNNFNKLNLKIAEKDVIQKTKKEQVFTVVNKTELNSDNTFLIELKRNCKTKFTSGDLLAITPKNETRSRLYSIGKIDKNILLSIKKHQFGLCSNYFNSLNKGDEIAAEIQKNEKFHLPKKAKEIILIANGTGIAPFLGMINKNNNKKVHLFWGGRTEQSLDIYKENINKALEEKNLTSFYCAYSQGKEEQMYIQNKLLEHSELFINTLQKGNCIMICGSINMQNDVEKLLEKLTIEHLKTPLERFKNNNQIKTDCY